MRKVVLSLVLGYWWGMLSPAVHAEPIRETEPVMPGGWAILAANEEGAQAAAQQALSIRSAVDGEVLQLVSIQEARRQVVAGLNYHLRLGVLQGGKLQFAIVTVWAKLDGTYALTEWSWQPPDL